jgi:hypothetical protein
MKTKEQELPEWFKGMIYKEGATVTNPFSGESYELNGIELSLYDFIMGCQMIEARVGLMSNKMIKEFRKALDWFRVNNPEAYMVLLD